MCGSSTMNTKRLRNLLGGDFDKVIRYSTEAAFHDSLAESQDSSVARSVD